jgi:growth factor-regulated tyrosine kinase substrate
MIEIASREFIDNLTSLLKAVGPAEASHAVKEKILELIQNWATAAEGRSELSYIGTVYSDLGREGFRFPPRESLGKGMFDSSAPPEWADSDVCMRCRTAFTFTNRKHHCRNCGNVFDQQCSAKTLPLPHLGIMQAVRVDDGCYQRLMAKSQGIPDTPKPAPPRTLYQNSQPSMQPREARVRDDDAFDADLKRALEMSLEETKAPVGQGYVPSSQLPQNKSATTNGTSNNDKPLPKPAAEEEDDPDLAAAIAASLADVEEQKKQHATAFKQQTSNITSSNPYTAPAKPDYELTPQEAENINLFATLVERLASQPPGTILREPMVQELYEGIGRLRPKMARTFGEVMSKHDTLLDLHSKLASVVRYYDRMLEERMNRTYSSQFAGYSLPSHVQPPSSNPYPTLGGNAPSQYGSSAGVGGAESFYTGRPSAAPSDPYQQAPSQQTYGYPQPSQAPTNPYPQPLQHDPSYPPPEAQPSYPPSQQGYAPQSQPQLQRAPSTTYAVSQPSSSPTQQRIVHPQSQQFPPSQQPPQETNYYFTQNQNQNQPSQPSQPQSAPPSPLEQYSSQPNIPPQYSGQGGGAAQAPYPTNPNQGYTQQPVQGWGAGGAYPGMPDVPRNVMPQVPKVEEALIEL